MEHIQQIVHDYTVVKNSWFEVFKLRAISAISSCRDVVHSLAEGEMIVEKRSPFSFGSQGIKSARHSIKAVTLNDGSFWRSIHGEGYLKANREAVKRGVHFIRIFLNSREKIATMIDVMKMHQHAGVQVYVAFTENLPKELYDDFVVMDDKLFNCAEFDLNGRIKHWKMGIDSVEVELMNRKFSAILRSARRLEDVINTIEAGDK